MKPVELVRKKKLGLFYFSKGLTEIGIPTRIGGKRCIDFAISSSSNGVIEQQVLHRYKFSDHYPIRIMINGEKPIEEKRRLILKEISTKEQKMIIQDEEWKSITEPDQVPIQVFKILDKYKCRIRTKPKKWPYYTQKTKRLIIKLATLKRNNPEGVNLDELSKATKRAKYKDLIGRRLKWLKTGVKQMDVRNSSGTWRWLNKCFRSNKGFAIHPIKDEEGKIRCSIAEISKVFEKHCGKVAGDPNNFSKNYSKWEIDDKTYDGICDEPILWSVLKTLKRRKAPGIDSVQGDFYRMAAIDEAGKSELAKLLIRILNKVFKEGKIPECWNTAIMVMIPKKGDLSLCDNYRGIALINTLCKILTKVINCRIKILADENNWLRKEQAGFREGEECIAQATYLTEILQRRTIKGKMTHVCFIDFKKAYDMVGHAALIWKLANIGIGGNILRIIRSIYKNPNVKVRIDKHLSESYEYKRGVKQGCPLSPLLFNLYINDIFDDMKGVKTYMNNEEIPGLLFADDTVIFGDSKEDLEYKLKQLEEWCDKWGMEVNPQKCGIMRFKDETLVEERVPYKVKGTNIPETDNYVYLGVVINQKLDYSSHIERRKILGDHALRNMNHFISNRMMPVQFKRMVIKSCLYPILTYGIELYGLCEQRIKSIRNIICKALQRTISASQSISHRTILEEMKMREPMVFAGKMRIRAIHKWKNSRLSLKSIFTEFKSRKTTWYTSTKRYLNTYLKGRAGMLREDTHMIEEMLTRRMRDRDKSRIVALRQHLNMDSYNPIIINYQLQLANNNGFKILVKLRIGDFFFGPRLSKMNKIPQEYVRICPCCNSHTPESMIHFIEECSALNETRSEFMREINIPNIRSFYVLNDIFRSKKSSFEKKKKTLKFLEKMTIKRYSLINKLFL